MRFTMDEINLMRFPTQFFAFYNTLIQEKNIERAETMENALLANSDDSKNIQNAIKLLRNPDGIN